MPADYAEHSHTVWLDVAGHVLEPTGTVAQTGHKDPRF